MWQQLDKRGTNNVAAPAAYQQTAKRKQHGIKLKPPEEKAAVQSGGPRAL